MTRIRVLTFWDIFLFQAILPPSNLNLSKEWERKIRQREKATKLLLPRSRFTSHVQSSHRLLYLEAFFVFSESRFWILLLWNKCNNTNSSCVCTTTNNLLLVLFFFPHVFHFQLHYTHIYSPSLTPSHSLSLLLHAYIERPEIERVEGGERIRRRRTDLAQHSITITTTCYLFHKWRFTTFEAKLMAWLPDCSNIVLPEDYL